MSGIHSHGVAGLGSYYPNNAGQNTNVYYYPQPPQEAIAQAAQAAVNQHHQQQQQAQQAQQAHQQQQQNEKKRSFDGVDQFFEDAKRHKIQPVYDGAMAQRLSALQFAPSTTADLDFGGHTVTAPAQNSNQQFTLPSLRTKQDLIDADNFLTQLSANVYDASGNPFPFRANPAHSPHTPNTQVQQQQQHSPQSQHEGAPPAPMANSQSSGTAALTPPQSNYTTSHSPHNQHSPPGVSPQSSGASTMYPTLPTAVSNGDVNGGYPAPVSSAPVSSLGSTFDAPENRRYAVGVLRKANLAKDDIDMDYVDDSNQEIGDAMIDPSLGALTEVNSAAAVQEKAALARDSELIGSLREYVKMLLTEEEEREKRGEPSTSNNANGSAIHEEGQGDHDMGEAPEQTEQDHQLQQESKESQQQTDAQALYPILKAVEAC